MKDTILKPNSLVLYKGQPARVLNLGAKKVTIEVDEGSSIDVRYKDIQLLHIGPLNSLSELRSVSGELQTAWELLEGETTDLEALADLIYDEVSPATVWSTWALVADGLYFRGEPAHIYVRTLEEVETTLLERENKERELAVWNSFIQRVSQEDYAEEDEPLLQDTVDLALGRRARSKLLKTLKLAETPENAHALLLRIGYWDPTVNPYPERYRLTTDSSNAPIGSPEEEVRRDLRHLTSYAIDDEGSSDPDDALSIEGNRLWVHIADPAALITPESPADDEAMNRGANLYLPEVVSSILPTVMVREMALGLTEESKALSFGIALSETGEILDFEFVPSVVKVTRLTYEEAEGRLQEPILSQLANIAIRLRKRRLVNGAVEIQLPEVKVQVRDRGVEITPLHPLMSREIVREAMLIAGEAVAAFAQQHDIPMPFTTQENPVDLPAAGSTLSQMFAVRNTLKPSRKSATPASHSGLGLKYYIQATSPLRRYLDLVVHQQLRARLLGKATLDSDQIVRRIGAAESIIGSIRQAERDSRKHWTLVYLMQNPEWTGSGYIVDRRGARYTCLIPDLDLEVGVYPLREIELDSEISLKIIDVDLAQLQADFAIIGMDRS